MSRVDSGYRSAMSVQSSLVMHPINEVSPRLQPIPVLTGNVTSNVNAGGLDSLG